MVAVAGLIWLSLCVFSGRFFPIFYFFVFFIFKRTRSAASMRPPCLIHLFSSTGIGKCNHYTRASEQQKAAKSRQAEIADVAARSESK